MTDSLWLEKARTLRGEAWEELQASPAYVAFKAFDDAVVSLGGNPLLQLSEHVQPVKAATTRVFDAMVKRVTDGRKLSQGDAAEIVLKQHREPLPIGRLMEAVIARGVEIGGSDPLNNFRSTMSKDQRFQSRKRNNMYFWWIAGEPLPSGWDEPPPMTTEYDDLLGGDSNHSSQEGGDGHDPATT